MSYYQSGSYVDETLFGKPHRQLARNRGKSKENDASASQAAVVPSGYLDYLHTKVASLPQDTERRKKKEELHELSKQRAANWPNTIEAMRAQKERRLQEKRDIEEQRRLEQDKEEARIQDEKRRETLERAQRLMYQQNDRVKTLQSALMLSEVVKEREQQVEFKKYIHNQQRQRDQLYHLQTLAQLKIAEEEQAKKEEEAKQKARLLAMNQQEQLAAEKARAEQRRQELMEEGELIRAKALEDIELEKQEQQERRQRSLDAVLASKRANEYLQDVRRQDKERAAEDERKLQQYQEQKYQLEQMKKQRMEERFKAKLAIRQRLIDEQAKRLADTYAANQARLDAQVREMAEKTAYAEKVKADKRAEREAAVHRSRQQQLARKQQQKELQMRQEEEYRKQWRIQNQLLVEEDKAEKVAIARKNREVAAFLQRQVDERRAHGDFEKQQELLEAEERVRKEAQEEEQFHEFAQQMINEFALEGKPLTPIQAALRK